MVGFGKLVRAAISWLPRSPSLGWNARNTSRPRESATTKLRSVATFLPGRFIAAAVRTSLTRDVLQNNPPCQDVELNSAVRNWLRTSCKGESRERSGQARTL